MNFVVVEVVVSIVMNFGPTFYGVFRPKTNNEMTKMGKIAPKNSLLPVRGLNLNFFLPNYP